MTLAVVNPTQSKHDRILIVGCGIGGVCTALALARRGIPVRVLERAAVISEIGAGLQIGPNARRILIELNVATKLLKQAVLPERAIMRDIVTQEELVSFDFTQPFVERFQAPYSVMHRGDLLMALMTACAETELVTIQPAKDVVDLVEADGIVTASCADGTSFTADGVIGADGIRSRVRAIILEDSPPLASKYAIYRATARRDPRVKNEVTLYAGHQHHIMQYPISGGDEVNLVCSFKSERDVPGGDAWGTVDELYERFANVGPDARWAVEQLDTKRRWVQFDREPQPGWARGRVVLTGDAAHVAHQYLAQGACQAMEDAVVMAELVNRFEDDIEGAFLEFERVRFPRTTAVQRAARFWGEMSHLGGAEAEARNTVLKRIAPNNYEFLDWLYSVTPVQLPNIPPHRDEYRRLESELAAIR
jgi:3-hydroxybenzoate 6-monooxygenase